MQRWENEAGAPRWVFMKQEAHNTLKSWEKQQSLVLVPGVNCLLLFIPEDICLTSYKYNTMRALIRSIYVSCYVTILSVVCNSRVLKALFCQLWKVMQCLPVKWSCISIFMDSLHCSIDGWQSGSLENAKGLLMALNSVSPVWKNASSKST